MRYLKLPLAWLFGLAVRMRSHLYKRGFLSSKKLQHPVICIGNLTLGGTGKTPLVTYLAIRLKESGFSPVILSRGYKGKLGSSAMLVSDGKQISGTPESCGDEPYLLAHKLDGVVVAVGKDRFKAGQAVGDQPEGTIFLLDDGFQHWKLQRQLDLLLIDGSCPLKKEALLPAGRLREPLSAMARADAIVITREHLTRDMNELLKEIRVWNPTAPIFPFSHEFDEILDLGNLQRSSPSEWRGKKVIALAAIGNPGQFLKDLELAEIVVEDRFLYPDHHPFSQAELDSAFERSRQLDAAGVITTEKDAVRLQRLRFENNQLFAVSIKAKTKDPDTFLNWVLQKLNKKRLRY